MTTQNIPQIDVEKVLKTRAAKIERYIPQFLINWFKGFIHQDKMNGIIRSSTEKGLKDVVMAQYGIKELGAKTQSVGLEHIPTSGGAIIAGNHPLGGLDGLATIAETGKVRPDVKFIVNDILMNIPNFEGVFVGVNKHGSNVKTILASIEEVYASNQLVLIFPAGLCSRRQENGKVEDLEWQKSFVAKSLKYKLPVIPMFVDGNNSSRFYNIAYWRKKLGIKINFEMLMLPDEMVRQDGKEIKMIFGKPIPAETFDKRFSALEWAQVMKQFVYELKANPTADFETFIKTKN